MKLPPAQSVTATHPPNQSPLARRRGPRVPVGPAPPLPRPKPMHPATPRSPNPPNPEAPQSSQHAVTPQTSPPGRHAQDRPSRHPTTPHCCRYPPGQGPHSPSAGRPHPVPTHQHPTMRTAAADRFERDAAHRDGARQSAMSRQNSCAEGSLREGARVSVARAVDRNMTLDVREYARGRRIFGRNWSRKNENIESVNSARRPRRHRPVHRWRHHPTRRCRRGRRRRCRRGRPLMNRALRQARDPKVWTEAQAADKASPGG